jgi:two-component system, NtrC family, sensor histidine kinase HydH
MHFGPPFFAGAGFMNRRILIQVTAPAVIIGALLFGTCLLAAWYINRLQSDLSNVLSRNVNSLKAAEELEIRVRQLRFHSFTYLSDPKPERLEQFREDDRRFADALQLAKDSSNSDDEIACVAKIETNYRQYHDELVRLPDEMAPAGSPIDIGKLVDAHPIQKVVYPCQELFRLNKERMDDTAEKSASVGRQARWTLIFLGFAGPISGLIIGYSVARGISRSIYRLSVRVQDMAQRLDQDVASVSITADGDIRSLDNQLQHVVGRVEEVAERLQRHQRDMLRAEQLSAVGQLAAGVAHEVRNPLTSVKMLVEAALRPQNRKALNAEDLQVIHREIARLEQTVQGFLDFARPPIPQRAACDLRKIVAQALELVQVRARQQKVDVQVRVPEQAVCAEVDRSQLCTVLVNLYLNALDAMPHGGRLRIELDCASAQGTRLVIMDSGSGIPAEVAPRLFTPFTSSKPTGTGLGLSISRRIMEEHGGRLTGANQSGGGACFTITLPSSWDGPIAGDEARASTAADPLGNYLPQELR